VSRLFPPGLSLRVEFCMLRSTREIILRIPDTDVLVPVHLMLGGSKVEEAYDKEARRFVSRFLQSGADLWVWVPGVYCKFLLGGFPGAAVPGQILVGGVNLAEKLADLGYLDP